MGTVTYQGTAAAVSAATYTYSGTPSNSDSDRLRFEVGDIGMAGTAGGTVWMFSNEELEFVANQETSWSLRIAYACEVLARKWSRIPDFMADSLRVNKSQVAKAYADRAKELRMGSGIIRYGEINVTRKDGYSDDIEADETDSASRTVNFDTIRYVKGQLSTAIDV